MKIRLIELFAGIGAQAKALENLGVDFEHYKAIEWDKYAVKSYNAIHGTQFEPSDITKIKGADLEIIDTDKYKYILTYSFPCQDLSLAGKQAGMEKGAGTRSGLLWEVERLLNECAELPQVLLMENVTQVHGKKNIDDFKSWCKFLESKGYCNYWQDLNAKNYGIPQNRNRCFMISLLGGKPYEEQVTFEELQYNAEAPSYKFPEPFNLKLRLKDLLENEVDEKYYLSNKGVNYILNPKRGMATNINPDISMTLAAKGQQNWTGTFISDDIDHIEKSGTIGSKNPVKIFMKRTNDINGICKSVRVGGRADKGRHSWDFVIIPEATKKGYAEAEIGDSVNFEQPNSKTRRGRVGKGIAQTINTAPMQAVVEPAAYRIRKLTPLECWRLMGFDDADFYKAQKVNSNTQLYKQAGNSIVVNVLEEIFKQLLEGE